MDNNGTQLNDSNVVFDEDGMKVLMKCKNCGGDFWVKQGKVFKKWFKGRCPVCGWTTIAKVGVRKIQTDENGEKIEPFKDEDEVIRYLNKKSIEDVDPMLCAAANMIRDLSDRHWSECWQIGVYSNAEDIKELTIKREDALNNDRKEIRRSEWELPKTLGENVLVWKKEPYPSWVIANLTVVEGEKVWMEYRPWDDGYNPPRKIEDGPFWMPLPLNPEGEDDD